ncbi:MAG: alpha/beta hydrolase [Cyclobacteriaceae bacterium]
MVFRFILSRKLRLALLITVCTYVLSLILFYIFRDRFIFQSTQLSHDYQFEFTQPFQEYSIKTSDSIQLNGLLFKSSTPSQGLIFYTHGNAGNLQRWGNYAVDFTQLGYDVFMYDYRGYGKSEGESDASNLYTDGNDVYNWVIHELKPSQIILYGRSLGSTVASHLSTMADADTLILETPFAEFNDVIYWPLKPIMYVFPMNNSLSNLQLLPNSSSRKFIFHGTDDWVVPLSSALKLKPLLAHPNDFIIIEGGGHKNLRDFESYHVRLKEILE